MALAAPVWKAAKRSANPFYKLEMTGAAAQKKPWLVRLQDQRDERWQGDYDANRALRRAHRSKRSDDMLEAAGKEAKVMNYDPKGFEKPDGFKFKFPFRDTPFFVSVDKAADLLGFSPKFSIVDDISWYYSDQYVAKGGLDKELSFDDDELVLGAELA